MSKGLEALNAFERICEHIRQIDYDKENIKYYDTLDFISDVKIVKEQLLQKTKNNANDSCKNKNEAVENLKEQFEILGIKENPYLKIIEKELKALEVIKEKKPSIQVIWHCEDYNAYKEYLEIVPIPEGKQLTQEEFDLLKEVLL